MFLIFLQIEQFLYIAKNEYSSFLRFPKISMVFLILDRFLYKDSVCRQEVGGTTEDTHRYFSAPCCVLTKLERWLVMMSGEARCEAIISAIIKSSDLPSRSLHSAVWKILMSF